MIIFIAVEQKSGTEDRANSMVPNNPKAPFQNQSSREKDQSTNRTTAIDKTMADRSTTRDRKAMATNPTNVGWTVPAQK